MQKRSDLDRYDQSWWTAKPGRDTAQAITRVATRREIASIPNRWRSLVFYQMMTGRPSMANVVYGMAKRPTTFENYYSSFQFSGMKSGFACTMADVYANRLLGHQTFISMIPVKGDAEQNAQAQELEDGLELADDQLGYQRERATMFTEAFWYGTGFMYFGQDMNGNPMLEAVNRDELLYANPDDTNPYDVIRRRWGKKTELLEQYKDNKEAVEAILKAPNASPAFYFGNTQPDCTDIVPYLEGWTRPMSRSVPGRYVKVVGEYMFPDSGKWEYPHPFESWDYAPLPGSILGQGIAEKLYQVSQWIDMLLSTGVDSDVRSGKGKWLLEENSNVNPDALGDLNAAIVTYLGQAPEFVTPEPIGQYWLSRLEFLMNLGRSIVHVSEASVKGEMPAGITAAIAIEKYAQIDDQNFLEKIGRAEDFDKRAAYQKIMLFKRLKAKFTTGRRSFDWDTIKLNKNFRINDMQAYNVGRLAQTVAGRIQIVEQMRANNRIDDRTYNKFLQTPDIPGMFRDLNAETNDIDAMIDAVVRSDEYIPPSPYIDFDYARLAVERRYAREEKDQIISGIPDQAVLDRLSMWRATVLSFSKQLVTPDAPPSPAAGAPPMPGEAPAMPAPQGFGVNPTGAPLPPAALPPAPAVPTLPEIASTAVPA